MGDGMVSSDLECRVCNPAPEPNSNWYTQARVDELVRDAMSDALMRYADDLAANPSATYWRKQSFVQDVRTYARDMYRGGE